MEWSDLRVFLAIAREGALGGAARSLGQTQPTMGRRLHALESAVGHTLFQRIADGFVLTDEGNAILVHAERIEEEALALQRQLAGQEARLEGMLLPGANSRASVMGRGRGSSRWTSPSPRCQTSSE